MTVTAALKDWHHIYKTKGNALGMRLISIQTQCIFCKMMAVIHIVSEELQALVLSKREPLQACLSIPRSDIATLVEDTV